MVENSSDLTPDVGERTTSTLFVPETKIDSVDGDGSIAQELTAVETVMGSGAPQRVGRFRFLLDGQRWEWSDAVARMHGYEPGTVQPTTELLLQHKHPEDREQVAAVLDLVLGGQPFSSRHRIIDTAGHTHLVIVVGDLLRDDQGTVTGTSGFYIDVTEAQQSEITAMMSDIAASRSSSNRPEAYSWPPMVFRPSVHSRSWSGAPKRRTPNFVNSPPSSLRRSPARFRPPG